MGAAPCMYYIDCGSGITYSVTCYFCIKKNVREGVESDLGTRNMCVRVNA